MSSQEEIDYSKMPKFPQVPIDEHTYCSEKGLKQIAKLFDPKNPHKNFTWTTDISVELPIRMKIKGQGSTMPKTLVECFQEQVKNHPNNKALSVKRGGKWQTLTFKQYYDLSYTFGKALMAAGLEQGRSVNIIGFNSPEWVIAFQGSILAFCLPVGVYTTSNMDACHYLAEHSEAEIAIVENGNQLNKYLAVWDRLPLLKYVVIYNDKKPDNLPEKRKGQVLLWNEFLELGRKFTTKDPKFNLEQRISKIKPGHCCSLIYTSGTTGPPKGVMLSHDNYTWTTMQLANYINMGQEGDRRIVSYLPLSHVAGQILDIMSNILFGVHVYFADATALQGSLISYLQDVQPTWFFGVPRVWEKIEEGLKKAAAQNGWLKTKIATWAKSIGVEGTYAEDNGKSTPFMWNIAKKLVYKKVRVGLGFNKAVSFSFGAAPMSPQTRNFFLSLNINIQQVYGMSECTGPENFSVNKRFKSYDLYYLKSTGEPIDGTDLVIFQPDKDGNGEICYKGRNRFMGYYKEDKKTAQTIDSQGYLHSGDVGKIDKNGNLEITGRIKELIITAGGENVAPVLIENELKNELKCISNCMVVGDMKKFLAVLITLKHDANPDGSLKPNLAPDVILEFKNAGSTATTAADAMKCQKVQKYIMDGIARANKKAISAAQQVQKFVILKGDFSIDGSELTPTMKLKRNVTAKKYHTEIESMYIEAKL